MKRKLILYKNKLLHFCILSLILLLVSCNPQGAETVEDLDIVGTAFSKNFNFSAVKTYYMPNEVLTIVDSSDQNSNVLLNTSFNQAILNQIVTNLNTLGYIRLDTISTTQRPDVFVQVAALATTNTNIYYDQWWDYWGNYYSPYYPSYGYGYGSGFYPYPRLYASSYTTGTLIIEMTDPNNPNVNTNRIPSVWVASFQGLLSGSANSFQTRMEYGINQAFKQSPYL
jgi:hypothetical protein